MFVDQLPCFLIADRIPIFYNVYFIKFSDEFVVFLL